MRRMRHWWPIVWALPIWVWLTLAIAYWPVLPRWLAFGSALVWLLLGALAWRKRRQRWTGPLVGLAVLLIAIGYAALRPRVDRAWAADHARQTTGQVVDGILELSDVRHATAAAVRWEQRRYAVADCQTVDLFVVPFGGWRGPAHVMVSLGFADGTYLCVSVEARRQAGESYSPLAGMHRHYELIYVIGDERDIIARRLLQDGDPVYRYRLRASRDQAQALLLDLVARANALRDDPEFYHSLFNSCASNLRDHGDRLLPEAIGHDWRVWLPGYAESLLQDHQLVDGQALQPGPIDMQAPDRLDATWSSRLRGLGD